jgi:hypothetical protein
VRLLAAECWGTGISCLSRASAISARLLPVHLSRNPYFFSRFSLITKPCEQGKAAECWVLGNRNKLLVHGQGQCVRTLDWRLEQRSSWATAAAFPLMYMSNSWSHFGEWDCLLTTPAFRFDAIRRTSVSCAHATTRGWPDPCNSPTADLFPL